MNQGAYQNWLAERQQLIERIKELEKENAELRKRLKQPPGLFARMAAKVAAFTMLQYFNLLNHKPIGQVKYALF